MHVSDNPANAHYTPLMYGDVGEKEAHLATCHPCAPSCMTQPKVANSLNVAASRFVMNPYMHYLLVELHCERMKNESCNESMVKVEFVLKLVPLTYSSV